jgi:molybdate transport system substrate-binding protein
VVAAVVSAVLLGTAGCSGAAPAVGESHRLSGTITVFAAASLTESFGTIATRFEAEHPGVTVATSFAGSSDLVTQITAGAPADVFASADARNMAKVASLVGIPVDFATNVLEIAVPPGNPAKIATFSDLARAGAKTVVRLTPVSEETAVTDVLGKVSAGEADAGLVYVTDIRGAGSSVQGIPFPESSTAVNTYPIAVLRGSADAALAKAFVDYVTGPVGRSVLAAAGFGAP